MRRSIITFGLLFLLPTASAVGQAWQQLLLPQKQNVHMTFGFEVFFDEGELLISAPGDSEDALWSGAIEVFRFEDGQWRYQYSIRPSVAEEGQNFGRQVERSGDQFLVRAQSSLFVFERVDDHFVEVERVELEISEGHQACCGFLANSTHVFIQEFREIEPGHRIGALLVYRRDGSTWTFVQRIKAPTTANLNFGGSLCMSTANELLVGAGFQNDSRVTEIVEYFVLDQGSWRYNQSIYPREGQTIRVRNNGLACTADWMFAHAPDTESVLVFYKSDDAWSSISRVQLPGPYGAQPPISTTDDRLNLVTRMEVESGEGETTLVPAVAFAAFGPEGWWSDWYVINPYPEETESWSFGYAIAENDTFRAIASPYSYQGASKVGSVLVQALIPIETTAEASIGDGEPLSSIEVFPNPTHSELTVDIADVDPIGVEVQIYDIAGRRLLSTRVRGAANRIDVSRLSRGTYFVRACRANHSCDSAAFIKH